MGTNFPAKRPFATADRLTWPELMRYIARSPIRPAGAQLPYFSAKGNAKQFTGNVPRGTCVDISSVSNLTQTFLQPHAKVC